MLLVYQRPSGNLPVDQELFFSLKFVFRHSSSLSFSTQVGRESLFCVRTKGGLGGPGGQPRPTSGSARLFDRAPFVAVAWILFHRLILQLLWRNLSSPSLWTRGICGGYVCQGLPKGLHVLSSRAGAHCRHCRRLDCHYKGEKWEHSPWDQFFMPMEFLFLSLGNALACSRRASGADQQ